MVRTKYIPFVETLIALTCADPEDILGIAQAV